MLTFCLVSYLKGFRAILFPFYVMLMFYLLLCFCTPQYSLGKSKQLEGCLISVILLFFMSEADGKTCAFKMNVEQPKSSMIKV